MLRFESIGDGNCLYNTEAVWLVKCFREGKLKSPLNKADFVQNSGRLLSHTSEFPGAPNLKAILGSVYTKDSVSNALQALIRHQSSAGNIDWVGVQTTLAQGLRALVAERIQNEPVIREYIKQELIPAINQSIEISTSEEVQLSFHFDAMPEIRAKVAEIVKQDQLSLAEKQVMLRNWFFNENGESVGLNYYLYGEQGISTPTIEAGLLEMKVLSSLFRHVIRFYDKKQDAQGHHITVVNGFKPREEAERHPKNTLVCHIEKVGNHWNALLPNTKQSKAIIDAYAPQRAQYIFGVQQSESDAVLQQILAEHGSFDAHRQSFAEPISIDDYLAINSITREEYDQNRLPVRNKPSTGNHRKAPVEPITNPIKPNIPGNSTNTTPSNTTPNIPVPRNKTASRIAVMICLAAIGLMIMPQLSAVFSGMFALKLIMAASIAMIASVIVRKYMLSDNTAESSKAVQDLPTHSAHHMAFDCQSAKTFDCQSAKTFTKAFEGLQKCVSRVENVKDDHANDKDDKSSNNFRI